MRHTLFALLIGSVACGESAPASKQPAAAGSSSSGGVVGSGGNSSGGSLGGGGTAGNAGAAGANAGSGGGEAPVLGANESYEAEDAFDAGSATFVASTTDVSGSGYVDALGTLGAKLIFAVNAAADGPSAVRLRFRNSAAPKNVTLFVNGTNVATTTLSKSDTFVEHQQMLTLRAGLNTIAFVNAGDASTAVSIDHLTLQNGAARPARGATVPFIEYEAEVGTLSGTATSIGPDTLVGTLAANASGRRAVTLAATGDSVEWTTTAPASGLTVRYSLPDAPAGGGVTGSLTLYVDGQKRQDLALSSKNAWVYDPYPFNNAPGSGVASRLFSESRFVIGDVAAGGKVRLQRDAADAPPITLDLIALEPIPAAYAQPPGSVSISAHGATADDESDDSAAFTAAVAAAKATSQVVWIPAGHYTLGSRVDLDHVTVRGAGPWHSELHGKANRGGFYGTGDAVQLLDFAFIGDQDHRDDSFDSAIDGKFGQNSLIFNLFIQSSKAGIWLIDTSGAYVAGSRISDTYADGINLNTNVTYSAAEHLHIRNTGDDGMAIWSKGASAHNRFKLDTVHVPYHASAIAVYGGDSHHVEDCDVADTVRNGAGIQIGTRHDPVPFAGTTVIARSTLGRTSSLDVPNADCFGALWLFADTKDMDAPILLRDLTIASSACNAIYFTGSHAVKQVQLDDIAVQTAGGAGLKIETAGSGTFNGVSLTGALEPASVPPAFTATKGAGNVGW